MLSIFLVCELLNKSIQIKIIILSLIIFLTFDDFLFRGYQEILLFSFFIFLSKNFYIYLNNKKTVNLLVCFLCINLIPWIKHEGFLFSLIFTFSILLIIKNLSKKFEVFAFVFLTWISIIFKNFIFYKYLDLNFFHGGGTEIIFEFNSFIEFILIFSKGFLISIIKYKLWIFIFIAIYFLSKTKILNIHEKIFQKFLKINLILFFMLLVGIYYNFYINSGINFNWWIATTLDRLIYSISGIFVILTILATNYVKKL